MPKWKRTATRREHTFRRAWALLDAGDSVRALELFRAGARSGDSGCAVMVGYCFDIGDQVPQSTTRALYWYHLAAALGDALGATNIGVIHRERQNWALAERWFRRAIELGNPDAALDLAKVLANTGRSAEATTHLWRLVSEREVLEGTRDEAVELLKALSR